MRPASTLAHNGPRPPLLPFSHNNLKYKYLAQVRVLRAILMMSFLLAVGLSFLVPDVAGFEDALRLMEKKQDGAAAASGMDEQQQQQHEQRGTGWLLNMIQRTSALLQRSPVKDWAYLSLAFFIVARKKDSQTYALGIARHWILLTPSRLGEWPWLPHLHAGCAHAAAVVPPEYWRPFDTTPKHLRSIRQQTGGSAGEIVDDLLSAAAAATGSMLASASAAGGSPRGGQQRRRSPLPSPPRSPRHGAARGHSPRGSPRASERPIKEHMRRAQALAEGGRFVDAGAAVEEGIARCRGSLRNGAEEEVELWVVAAAFYEAAQTSPQARTAGGGGFMGRQRCLQRAGELAVRLGRWARGSELFDEAAQAWYEEKARGSPFGLVASGKAAPLVLGSILATLVFGDHVKAQQLYKMACFADRGVAPGFGRTPEGDLAAAVLEAVRGHDAKALMEGRARYAARGKRPDAWMEEALTQLKGRVEEGGALLR